MIRGVSISMIRNGLLIGTLLAGLLLFVSCTTTIPEVEIVDEADIVEYCNEWDEENIANGGEYLEGELLVGFIDDVSLEDAEAALGEYEGLAIDHSVGNRPIFVVFIPNGEELEWICTLKENSLIESVELSYYLEDESE